MSKYDELVKALRERQGLLCYGEGACPENCELLMNHGCYTKLHMDAAAAIEELQFELDCVNDSVKMLSLPIDGKWIRVEGDDSYHYECSRCGERPLYSRYGDVVLSGVCPMCGAKMTEVQDETEIQG